MIDVELPPGPASSALARGFAACLASVTEVPVTVENSSRSTVKVARDASRLVAECDWLVANDVLPADVVTRNRRLAETALRPWTPVFTHGDLQVDHVFVAGDEVTGIVDWSEGSQGDALFDLATLTVGHPEHHGQVVGDEDHGHPPFHLEVLEELDHFGLLAGVEHRDGLVGNE